MIIEIERGLSALFLSGNPMSAQECVEGRMGEKEYKPEKTDSCYFAKNYHRIGCCEDCWAKDLCPHWIK